MLKGKLVMVTGNRGFIGSVLETELWREGATVIGWDTVNGFDLGHRDNLREAMTEVDYVFHMAVLPLGACTRDPRACLEININGTFNLIEAARGANVKKVVFSSASSVYGDTDQTMDESHPLNAETMYGASKIAGEYFLRAFYDMYKLDYVILRYMNVYGPGQEGGLIMNTLNRIKEGLPPIIFGDGSQSFDFVYVDDVVEANILAMEKSVTDEAFNIGGEEEITVKELVVMLLELTGSNLTPQFKLEEKVPMQRRVGSSQKAKTLLGYSPKVPLQKGLQKVIKSLFEVEAK